MDGALSHVKVLDLSRVLAGPWASQMLADLGADVIKVERPGSGDDTRNWGPPFLHDRDGQPTRDAAYYLCANRNKRSVTIDITTAEGQQLVRELAARCDVLVENYKVGGLAQYGLDYATLHAEFPRLVYCSITGFGQTGPYAPRAGYDFLVQAMGGLMSVTGRAESEQGAGPLKVGVAVADLFTGLYASNAILAALAYRERSGTGQHIDLALLDVQVACMANQGMNFLYGGRSPGRLGNAHPNVVPYQDFPTADGDVIIAVGNDGQFARLCTAIGRPALATDERFATNLARIAHRVELIRLLRECTLTRSTDEWVAALEAAEVPCGPINDLARVFEDAQVIARGMKIEVEHATAGAIPLVANPIRMSASPVAYRRAPPTLGQHTREVLADELGCDAGRIDRLAASRVI
ncbi:CaiB/BaiF CoA-transferase family protein [Variovorax sp.]|jgi:crotonobetainyl-CoA:carnitine CoA-transferase CaiB-like acyl-CoA transferase|uniref:CaiB/BaiF CoA transferase family protein n=1 Tax=Variovorax sp. TaxID=1871043 RepID=UPI00122BED07|nr:CaiB/BaiF CoA-transferase family protein [Variovorax sp.]TAJ59688.1 MAG: CoA transferase [Variovorax sp.]